MTDTATEKQEKTGTWRDKALQVAGAGYSAGDIAMGIAANQRGEKNVFSGALIWLAGGLAAARYGKPNVDKQLELFTQKFEHHLKQQGVTIPDDVRAQNTLLKKPGFIEKCEAFLYQHPSEMLNLAYAIGSAFLLKDGFKELAEGEKKLFPKFTQGFGIEGINAAVKSMSKNTWMGVLVGGGAVGGLLLKEDPNARAKVENGTKLEKAYAYIKEKPLRLTGTLYGANNIFTVLKAMEDHSNRGLYQGVLKPHYFSTATAVTYILSNVLLTTVSRDPNAKNFSSESLSKLEQVAAQIIAAEPAAKQKELLADVATYIAAQKGITLKAEDIAQALTERVTALTQERLQPAVNETKWAAREAAREESAVVVSR